MHNRACKQICRLRNIGGLRDTNDVQENVYRAGGEMRKRESPGTMTYMQGGHPHDTWPFTVTGAHFFLYSMKCRLWEGMKKKKAKSLRFLKSG